MAHGGKADRSEAPNIYLKQKKAGGMKITFQSPPKNLDEKMLYNILRDYRILNCEVLVRDENGKGEGAASQYEARLTQPSHHRPVHRRDHARPSDLHQMLICLQQD